MKKKILFVTNHFNYSNGVATALRSIILNINKEKYDIYLLPIYFYDKEFAEPVSKMITVLKGYGFYFRGFDKLIKFVSGKRIYKKFIKDTFDLEVSFQFGVPTRCIASSKNEHKICWMHTYDSKMKMKRYYLKYPKIITVSRVGTEKLINEGFSKDQCDFCYNIIDEDYINKMAIEKIQDANARGLIVVTVARMDPDKAYLRYVECINKIKDRINKNITFWLIGDGLDYADVLSYVKENNLDSVVKVLGRRNNPYAYMNKADLYFCGSLREGFSTSCQEAALLGLPVISVEVDGAKELIEKAGCGCVIPNYELSICDNLERILNDDHLISQWKEIAEENKIRFYKKERILKIESILDEAIS